MSKHALIYGGGGALGRTIVNAFRQSSWSVTSIDYSPKDPQFQGFHIQLNKEHSSTQSSSHVMAEIEKLNTKLDVIVNVAGGWAGGNLLDAQLLENTQLMFNQSVISSVISAKVAANYLKPGGLLLLAGAGAATHGTPSMIGYGMAKAAVHHLVKSCAGPDSGLPAGAKVAAILPVMLDTPMNRKFMGDGDTSTWTPLTDVSGQILKWSEGTEPIESGQLYKLLTEHQKTTFVPVA
ncbi:hypothetical protein BC833DRAFT_602482 [Globomyces pollinis-pini]|nr:hypothetical protein BC833DRAFT_602482 [Globomyces pollinis-pini]